MIKGILNFSQFSRSLAYASVGLLMAVSAFGETLPTASETAKAMGIGWNLGNTLEAISSETAWGNPVTTQKLIDSVKAAGFNTVRIPVAWDIHATNSVIDATWIARVKEVVDYCVGRNMYAIINIHWDNGWLENNCTEAKKAENNVKQKAYWTQIANYFKSYDSHLLFASANEPNVTDATGMAVLLSYHQTFIDAVRATGGNNSSRVLIVQGPSTDIEKTYNLMTTLPTDNIASHLMAEVHYYSPWNFCGLTKDTTYSWGKYYMAYFWGQSNHSTTDTDHNPTWGEETYLDSCFNLMKTQFVDKGIPVVLGEFGAIKRTTLSGADLTLHTASREYYNKYVAKAAISRGIIPVYWDNGASDFAVFNRSTGAITDKGLVKALIDGAGISTPVVRTAGKDRVSGGSGVSMNPLTGVLTLTVEDLDQVRNVVIFDQLGKRVKTLEHSSVQRTIQIGQDLKAGIYIIQIQGISGVQSFTISKY